MIRWLADGQCHSGEALGVALGVSRTAVWKHLKALREWGVEIQSVKGHGYCIPGGMDLLDQQKIRGCLESRAKFPLIDLQLHGDIDSTNSQLLEQGRESSIHRVVLLAERQGAGRGRRGRSWSSPYGRNIYLSLGWSFEGGASQLEGLSLVAGVAVSNAIAALSGLSSVKLKWPNDIYYDGRKLGGILVEVQGDLSGECHAVIGVGLNCGMPPRAGQIIDQPWADLNELGIKSRNLAIAEIITQLVKILEQFTDEGFVPFIEPWGRLDLCRDEAVNVISGNQSQRGIARGINASGGLMVDIDGECRIFHGGEVSLRIAHDS